MMRIIKGICAIFPLCFLVGFLSDSGGYLYDLGWLGISAIFIILSIPFLSCFYFEWRHKKENNSHDKDKNI